MHFAGGASDVQTRRFLGMERRWKDSRLSGHCTCLHAPVFAALVNVHFEM